MENNAATATAVVVKSKGYKNQAIKLLQNELFRGLSCAAIKLVLEQSNYDFTASYNVLSTIRADDLATVERIPAFQNQLRLKIFIKVNRKRRDVAITDRGLQDEIDNLPALNKKKSVNDDAAVEVIDLVSDDEDNIGGGEAKKEKQQQQEIECGCCYGDYRPEDMHECSARRSHHCCKGCVARYVSEQLDGNNNTNFCCIVDSDCDGVYLISQLDTFLSPKLIRRVNDLNFRNEIEEAAGSSGLRAWVCGKCSHVGFLEEPLHPTVFCPSLECTGIEYCRMCKSPAHPNMTCDQFRAENERLKDPVVRAQEAMSRATIRTCPDCRTPFQKHDGCNKITCSKCKALSCYLCRSRINGYDHFCNTINCPCNRCSLWGRTDEADRKARRDAGRKVLEEANMSAVEIERILNSSSPSRRHQEGNQAGQRQAPAQRVQPVQQEAAARYHPAAVPAAPAVQFGGLHPQQGGRQPQLQGQGQAQGQAPIQQQAAAAQYRPVAVPRPAVGFGDPQPQQVFHQPQLQGQGQGQGQAPVQQVQQQAAAGQYRTAAVPAPAFQFGGPQPQQGGQHQLQGQGQAPAQPVQQRPPAFDLEAFQLQIREFERQFEQQRLEARRRAEQHRRQAEQHLHEIRRRAEQQRLEARRQAEQHRLQAEQQLLEIRCQTEQRALESRRR